jgi:hypothetical protein
MMQDYGFDFPTLRKLATWSQIFRTNLWFVAFKALKNISVSHLHGET